MERFALLERWTKQEGINLEDYRIAHEFSGTLFLFPFWKFKQQGKSVQFQSCSNASNLMCSFTSFGPLYRYASKSNPATSQQTSSQTQTSNRSMPYTLVLVSFWFTSVTTHFYNGQRKRGANGKRKRDQSFVAFSFQVLLPMIVFTYVVLGYELYECPRWTSFFPPCHLVAQRAISLHTWLSQSPR